MRKTSVFCLAVSLTAAGAYAQGAADAVERARMHVGPVGITPSLNVTTLVDSNVFHDPAQPRQDVSMTTSPGARAWLRVGRSLVSVDGRGDFVYFRRYSGEGSLDGSIAGRFEIPVNRLTPWIEGRVLRGRQRVGYDIDARVERGEAAGAGGVNVRVLSGTHIGVYSQTADYRYGADTRVLGTDLRDVLNRRSTTTGASVSQRLTPLTTFVVQGETVRDRFVYAAARDSDSRRLLAGLDLDPAALISGRVRLGYRAFDARDGAAAFNGLVGSADAAYTLLGRVRFTVAAQRDLEYSYDLNAPHYLRTGAQLTALLRFSPQWDAQGRVDRQRLNYYGTRASVVRVDHVDTYGGGIGYRLGTSIRLGVNVERERRASVMHGRAFDGYRTMAALSYGG